MFPSSARARDQIDVVVGESSTAAVFTIWPRSASNLPVERL